MGSETAISVPSFSTWYVIVRTSVVSGKSETANVFIVTVSPPMKLPAYVTLSQLQAAGGVGLGDALIRGSRSTSHCGLDSGQNGHLSGHWFGSSGLHGSPQAGPSGGGSAGTHLGLVAGHDGHSCGQTFILSGLQGLPQAGPSGGGSATLHTGLTTGQDGQSWGQSKASLGLQGSPQTGAPGVGLAGGGVPDPPGGGVPDPPGGGVPDPPGGGVPDPPGGGVPVPPGGGVPVPGPGVFVAVGAPRLKLTTQAASGADSLPSGVTK